MKIIYEPYSTENCVATVGFFDGVHAGHRFLIDELKDVAHKSHLPAVVFTFAVHPRKVLHADYQPQLLTTLDEKLVQLASTGIDACVVLDFSEEMAKLSAYDFLKTILKDQYKVEILLVGHDHRFGHNRSDGFEQYLQYGHEMGIKVLKADRFSTDEHKHISSSDIRHALQTGDIQLATHILTYPYSFSGKVVKGFEVGRKIGFPTANLELVDIEKMIPTPGVYAVDVNLDGRILRGMMNIGVRPTLENGNHTSMEVHIFDFDADIYHQIIEVSFLKKIRDEQKFASVEDLVEQLKADKTSALSC